MALPYGGRRIGIFERYVGQVFNLSRQVANVSLRQGAEAAEGDSPIFAAKMPAFMAASLSPRKLGQSPVTGAFSLTAGHWSGTVIGFGWAAFAAGNTGFIMTHEITLITGDGVGPELAEAARRCVDATGVKINWDVQEAGVDVMARAGNPLPDGPMASVRRTRCALKAPITTPVGTGFRSINVHLRQELGLFACLRPCKYYPGVRSFFSQPDVDLVIVRENTEDLYAGVEFEAGQAGNRAS